MTQPGAGCRAPRRLKPILVYLGEPFVHLLGTFSSGAVPTGFTGNIQAPSNIEAPEDFGLFEAWIEQRFADGRLSARFGLQDLNAEFSALEMTGIFRNDSFGIGPDISQVGASLFPAAQLGLRLKLEAAEAYLQLAAFRGGPGEPHEEGNQLILETEGGGILYAAELGVFPGAAEGGSYRKLALGGWYHTTEYDDFLDRHQAENYGVYFVAERSLTGGVADRGLDAGLDLRAPV